VTFSYESVLGSFSQFGLEIFWRKNIGAKAAYKMSMTLTTGVNFVNILPLAFLNESALCRFSIITVCFEFLWWKNIGENKLPV